MSKKKSKKSVTKRFRVTKNGKVIRRSAKRGHLRAEKSPKKRRQHRRPLNVTGQVAKNIREIIGG